MCMKSFAFDLVNKGGNEDEVEYRLWRSQTRADCIVLGQVLGQPMAPLLATTKPGQ